MSNKYVAIKVVSKLEHMSIDSRTRLVREASIMKSLDHPLMADLFYLTEDESNSYLVMEYLENSSLLDLINNTVEEYEYEEEEEENEQNSNEQNQSNKDNKKHIFKIKPLDEKVVQKIFVQLIVALEFLHNVQHVAHRDIKAENVLLDRYNNIRIIDFGLSAIVQDDKKSLKRTVGSVAYTAPEILLKKPYSKSADIWSAGVLLYALSTSRLPFISRSNSKIVSSSKNIFNSNTKSNNNDHCNCISRSMNPSSFYDVYKDPKKMCKMILYGNLYIPSSLSPELQDLLVRMLERDPNKRITINEIEQHPFFSLEQYNMLMDFVKRQDKVEDIDLKIDQEIVSEMEARGINCDLLPQLLFLQEADEITAAYKEMKKVKVMKDLSDLYDELQKNDLNKILSPKKIEVKSRNINLNDSQSEKNENTNEEKFAEKNENLNLNESQLEKSENKNEEKISKKNENSNLNDLKSKNNLKIDDSSSQNTNQFIFTGLHKIVHDDNYEDSSENNTDNEIENNGEQRTFRKSQSVVISELNLNVLLNQNDPPSVQTSPAFNDNIKKLNLRPHPFPHTSSPPQSNLQNIIHSQMIRSQTSSLIFTPNESSDGTNTKIVPKSYMRPRIHLGLMNV